MRHPATDTRPNIPNRGEIHKNNGQKLWSVMIRAFFGLVVLLFCFPFCEFRVVKETYKMPSGEQVLEPLSGLNFITGRKILFVSNEKELRSGPSGKWEPGKQMQNIQPDVWAIFAMGAAIMGLFVSQENSSKQTGLFKGLAVAGFISLLIFQSSVSKYEKEIDEGPLIIRTEISLQFGYWAALWAMAVAGILSARKPGQSKYAGSETEPASAPIHINITTQWWTKN